MKRKNNEKKRTEENLFHVKTKQLFSHDRIPLSPSLGTHVLIVKNTTGPFGRPDLASFYMPCMSCILYEKKKESEPHK